MQDPLEEMVDKLRTIYEFSLAIKGWNFLKFICTSVFVRAYDTDTDIKNLHRNCYFCERCKHYMHTYKCSFYTYKI